MVVDDYCCFVYVDVVVAVVGGCGCCVVSGGVDVGWCVVVGGCDVGGYDAGCGG